MPGNNEALRSLSEPVSKKRQGLSEVAAKKIKRKLEFSRKGAALQRFEGKSDLPWKTLSRFQAVPAAVNPRC
jgi:hypothetical protein